MQKTQATGSPLTDQDYLMESEDENIRLDVKTDPEGVRRQALWCGVQPGMRILDAGCGPGRTSSILHAMVEPGGEVVGVDYSGRRIAYAEKHYGNQKGLEFHEHDIRNSSEKFGTFDLIWVRFVLEYHRDGAIGIVNQLIKCLKPGGTLCLLDLDYNCLIHYALPKVMSDILARIMAAVDEHYNFDTYVGRKLYSFLYDAGLADVEVELMAHNLFYGQIKDKDLFNLTKKIEMVAKLEPELVSTYPGGYHQFHADFERYLLDPRRFSYTPLLLCKGIRPLTGQD
ncbi:MAG: class I SAM-dependent methyltransferase [Smithellaceae bacterium]